jgi:hypothetical protein
MPRVWESDLGEVMEDEGWLYITVPTTLTVTVDPEDSDIVSAEVWIDHRAPTEDEVPIMKLTEATDVLKLIQLTNHPPTRVEAS